MPALTFFGRVSAISLFAAFQAASQAQSNVAAPQPPPLELAAAAPADTPRDVTVVVPTPAPTDEQTGDFFMMQQKYQAALDAYSKIAQPSAAVWNKIGIAHQMLFDPKNAARCYKESLKLDPANTGALNNLATIDDSRKNFSEAERLYRKALDINPRSARILKNLGTDLLLQHKYSESSEAFSHALALDSHIFDSLPGPTTETAVSVQERGIESYLKAQSCARAGLDNCALANLRQAFDEGSATKKQVANDNNFEALHQTPAYERLLAEQQ